MERGNKSEEDYLRIIYELEDIKVKGVRSTDLVKKLKINKASVSEMLRKLSSKGLIKFKPYSRIFLTKKGDNISQKLYEKNDLIKRFMKKLGHDNEKAIEEANNLEHAFSEESVSIIKKIIEDNKDINKITNPAYIG